MAFMQTGDQPDPMRAPASPHPDAIAAKAGRLGRMVAPVRGRAIGFGMAILVGLGGWAWGAYEHFVRVPAAHDTQRIGTTLDLVDRFYETPAHDAYMQLSDDLKPWWDEIEPIQREIMGAKADDQRDALIARRDASLIAFLDGHALRPRVDLLIQSFDQFTRCLAVGVCDEAILRGAISIDVKRIYRTFRPYILKRREGTTAGDKDFGRDLEDLFFRFVG